MTKSPALQSTNWARSYRLRLGITDGILITIAVFGAQLIRFGASVQEFQVADSQHGQFATNYTMISLLVIAGWMISLRVFDTRESRVIGTGPVEYKLVVDATVRWFGVLAIIALIARAQIARGYLIIAFPLGFVLVLVSRWLWRKWLHAQRRNGGYLHRTVLVGELNKARHVAQQITRNKSDGFKLVGAVVDSTGPINVESSDIPVVTCFESIIEMVDSTEADTVVLTSADVLDPTRMQRLGWELENRQIDVVVAPALTDIAGPRVHTRPVAGLPLIHIEYPRLEGRQLLSKRVFDVLGSAALILLLSPVLLTVAAAVKLTSPGPVLYRQERIGLNGKPFKMLKFRSMIPNADHLLADLLAKQGTADQPLFKITDDPRITPVGKFIRRYSLDELPQLFNALMGTMSLVGPRPQVAAEVALYDDQAHRRLLMKPGLTGLWQVSGRSNLSWEDSIRLDLYYVENWSFTEDIIILYRTVRTVLETDGAY